MSHPLIALTDAGYLIEQIAGHSRIEQTVLIWPITVITHISPLQHLSMSSEDWSQAATLAWLLQLRGKAAAECTVDCLRIDKHCNKQTDRERSVQ